MRTIFGGLVAALRGRRLIMAASSSRVLVYGGKGALGASIVNFFKGKNWVC